jgi:hypothetical protein
MWPAAAYPTGESVGPCSFSKKKLSSFSINNRDVESKICAKGGTVLESTTTRDSRFTCLDVAKAAGLREGPRIGQERSFACNRHNDEHPSLMINESKKTWMCGPCRKSGTPWQLAAFLAGLDPADRKGIHSWLTEHGINTTGNGGASLHGRQIVATYPYDDEAEKLLYEVVRFSPKGFAQRRPDGNGGWHWNLQDVRRVMYRLPEVLHAVDIFIVEGEKDADNLRSAGLTATTVPGGAGKWRPDYANSFKSHQYVIIIPGQ